MVDSGDVYQTLGWDDADHDPNGLRRGLDSMGYIRIWPETSLHQLMRPTYAAIVRVTQRVAGEWQARAMAMLEEGETTTVDFKRELHLDGVRNRGEFVRDVLGLATTKASGRDRYLLIGFDDETRRLVSSVAGSIKRDRLEDIVHAYVEPSPELDWVTFPFDGGTAGVVVDDVIRRRCRTRSASPSGNWNPETSSFATARIPSRQRQRSGRHLSPRVCALGEIRLPDQLTKADAMAASWHPGIRGPKPRAT